MPELELESENEQVAWPSLMFKESSFWHISVVDHSFRPPSCECTSSDDRVKMISGIEALAVPGIVGVCDSVDITTYSEGGKIWWIKSDFAGNLTMSIS